jgi:hypothetical protein
VMDSRTASARYLCSTSSMVEGITLVLAVATAFHAGLDLHSALVIDQRNELPRSSRIVAPGSVGARQVPKGHDQRASGGKGVHCRGEPSQDVKADNVTRDYEPSFVRLRRRRRFEHA